MPITFDNITIDGTINISYEIAPPVDNDLVFTVTVPESTPYLLELGFNEEEEITGTIYWGDGSNTAYNTTYVYEEHTYPSAGTYQIRVVGEVIDFALSDYVVSVDNWSNAAGHALIVSPLLTSVPNTLGSNISRVSLRQCPVFNDANVVTWDTTNLTNGFYMFFSSNSFNQPIGNWNTSNFTTLESMFEGATAFNQPIGNWNVGNVTTMYTVFKDATAFNQPIGNWNVGNVTAMSQVFDGATAFNQDLGNWNVGNVTAMNQLFDGATAFNQPIGNWNVSNVTGMTEMFQNATVFDQDLTGWCVTNIATLPEGFADGSALDANNYPVWGTCP